jgi:uncharacterized protein
MATYTTPGVYIHDVLSEPARVLRTGIPVFLGLVRKDDLDACNARLPEGIRFFELSLAPGKQPQEEDLAIVRRQGIERLPARFYPPMDDLPYSDPASANQYLILRNGQPTGSGDEEPSRKPQRFTMWAQFDQAYGKLDRYGFLTRSVRGFFENEGDVCYVHVICFHKEFTYASLTEALNLLQHYDDFDLVCVPDLAWLRLQPDEATVATLQAAVIDHCDRLGNRVALLDVPYAADPMEHRKLLAGENAALYYPWLRPAQGLAVPNNSGGFVPPSGYVAGIYNRCDRHFGVHKAPANELVLGAVDLQRSRQNPARPLNDEEQGPLNAAGINCLRFFPRRGVRVWGARTISSQAAWRYINVRRVILTTGRWVEYKLRDVVFEPHTPHLWERVTREVAAYLNEQARRGALLSTPSSGSSFYVKCDEETNPADQREIGRIVIEIGLAIAPPTEFIVIRLIHGPAGVQVEGPT